MSKSEKDLLYFWEFPLLITEQGKLCFKNAEAERLLDPPRRGATFPPAAAYSAEDAASTAEGRLLTLLIRGEPTCTLVFPMEYRRHACTGWVFLPQWLQEPAVGFPKVTEEAFRHAAIPFGQALSALSRRSEEEDALRQFHIWYNQKQRAEQFLRVSAFSSETGLEDVQSIPLSRWLRESLATAIQVVGQSLSYTDDPAAPLCARDPGHLRYAGIVLRCCLLLLFLSEDGMLSVCGRAEEGQATLVCSVSPRFMPVERFAGDLLSFTAHAFPAEYPTLFLQELLSPSAERAFSEAVVLAESDRLTVTLPLAMESEEVLCQPVARLAGAIDPEAYAEREATVLLARLLTQVYALPKFHTDATGGTV